MKMKAIGADYRAQYPLLADNHSYDIAQMLVVMKAYSQYLADVGAGKPDNECGRLRAFYDIGFALRHRKESPVVVDELAKIEPTFWDAPDTKGRRRLSDLGREFVIANIDVWNVSQELLGCVTQFRRG